MQSSRPTLIVGGSGHVGSRIAHRLRRQGRAVTIAGRDAGRGERVAAALGCDAMVLDLEAPTTWDAALASCETVLVCVDQADDAFVRRVLERGLDYVDVTASDAFFQRVEALGPLARETGATAVLSVGLAPGLTNLLVRWCVEHLDEAGDGLIAVRLGLGDEHGRAAIAWLLRELARGPRAPVLRKVHFAPSTTPMLAGPLDFADQHVVRRTLRLRAAHTVLTVESSLWTRLLFAAAPLMRFAVVRGILLRILPRLRVGSDECALAVGVTGGGPTPQKVRAGFRGREEARVTADIAAGVVELLATRATPGVHHVEQLFALADLRPYAEQSGGLVWFDEAPSP